MDIQVSKMRELLELFKPVIPKKSALKVTAFVCVREGKAIATDLETMVIAALPEAVDEKPMLLPLAPILEMLKHTPGTDMLQITTEDKKVKLTWPGGNASYPTEAPEEFPIPSPDIKVRAEADIDGDTLIPALLTALPYAAAEESRPTLCGVAVTLGSPIEVASADGFRLSHQVFGLSFPLEEKIIIPPGAVKILGHVFAKTPREPSTADTLVKAITARRQLHIALIDGKIKVDFGPYSVLIRLIEGKFPEVFQLIPKGEPILQSQVFAPQFEAALRRVKDVAKSGSGMVRLDFANGAVTISAKGDDKDIRATLDTLNTKGEPQSVGLDVKYLLEYFSKKEGIVVISRHSEGGSVSFQYQKTPKVLIMPMHIAPSETKTPEPEPGAPKDETEAPKAETTVENPETTEGDSETIEDDSNAEGGEQETEENTEETQEAVAP